MLTTSTMVTFYAVIPRAFHYTGGEIACIPSVLECVHRSVEDSDKAYNRNRPLRENLPDRKIDNIYE